jgi:hypothetical protein
MDMDSNLKARRRSPGLRWLGIEFAAVAALVTFAWINEPTSLVRFGLMCACWAPFAYGAARRLRERSRSRA